MPSISAHSLRIPLASGFRFIHEPTAEGGPSQPAYFVGREGDLEDLQTRLLYSEGGAFLVTGYRGVGKTSFVNQVIARLRLGLCPDAELIDIHLNLARSITPVELMHYMVRSLRLRLIEEGILARLEPGLAADVELAFLRTSFSVAYKVSSSVERSLSADFKVQLPALDLAPGVGLGSKRTSQSGRDLSYLSYDDKTAEYDLIQLSRRIRDGYRQHAGWRSLWRRRDRVALKLLFVFDELDKLEVVAAPGAPIAGIDAIFNALKNLFTASGISFVFIAGKDLQERWLEDVGRGDSIYESVFTYVKYLPTLDCGDQLCDAFLAERSGLLADAAETYRLFKQYLSFRGRGIPRRLLRGFNEYVSWRHGVPALEFSKEDLRRFRFYGGLLAHLSENEEHLMELPDEPVSGLADQRRLSLYYLTDWILSRETTEFSFEEGVLASRQLSRLIAPGEGVAPGVVSRLLKVLVAGEYLEEISRPLARLEVGATSQETVTRYRLASRRLAEMGRRERRFEREAEAVLAQVEAPPRFARRYTLGREVGRGAMSVVYDSTDLQTGRRVAVKVLDRALLGDPEYLQRFRREAEILTSLRHPNIVRVHDYVVAEDTAFIVMEFLKGVALRELEGQGLTLDLDVSLAIWRDLLLALEQMHAQNVVWRDAKPSNIMITADGRVVVMDFGISTLLHDATLITQTRVILGTPSYMSPEQATGIATDARSDLFALGTILYEMMTGELPFQGGELVETIYQILSFDPPPPSAKKAPDEIPAEIDALVLRCLAKRKEDRFQSARELLDVLPWPRRTVDLGALATLAAENIERQVYKRDRATKASLFRMTVVGRSSEPPQARPESGVPLLALTRPSERTFVLTAESYRIGRSVECDIMLDDPAVSRVHAELVRSGEGYFIQDLNTANGLRVDGRQVDRADLSDGSVIAIGSNCEMRYLAPHSGAGALASPTPAAAPPRSPA